MTEHEHTITVYFAICPFCQKLVYSFDKQEVSFDIFFHMTKHKKDPKEIQIPSIEQITLIVNYDNS